MRRTLEELRERRREAYEKLRAEQQAETIARQEQDRLNTDPLHGTVPTGILAERGGLQSSGDDIVNYVAVNIGQPEVTPSVTVSKPFVVQTEEMQDGRVQVVEMHFILD